jgi:histidinol-phosphate aminotransferase
MQPKKTLADVKLYQPGKPIEAVKRELGLTDVIKLASNENPFGCSPKVWEALEEDKQKLHFYPEGNAPALIEKLAEHLEVDERRLILGNGSDEIIQMLCRAYLEPGDEAVMASHTFPRYETEVKIEGATPVKVPLKDGTHDLEAMLAKVNDRTKIVWICNPNNPTGTFVTHDALSQFLDQLPPHVLVVLDEAYYEYVTDKNYPDSVSLLDYNPQIVILRTFSKIYGLAGLRIGYGIAHPEVIQQLQKVREPFNVNRLAQKATLAALEDETFVWYSRNQNRLGLEQVTKALDELGLSYYPSQTNFLLFDTGFPSDEVAQFLLREGIIVRPGSQLGFPTHLRVTIGKKEENERFLEGLRKFLKEKGR